jgi:uncharacterized membrane protein
MQVPFEGFVTPPLPHTVFLIITVVTIIAVLYTMRPPITQMLILAFAPWMVSGAALHVFYQLGEQFQVQLYPPLIEPLFSAPAVYLTTFISMGFIWIVATIVGQTVKSVAEGRDYVAYYVGSMGIGVMVTLVALVFWQAFDPLVDPEFIIPTVGLIVTLPVTFVLYVLLGVWRTYIIAEARYVGLLVLFSHVLDGVTTAIGVDILGAGERSVIPARIMEFAASLPTAEYLGSGWLFLVIKIFVAVAVIVLFADYIREEPTRGNLLFAFVAAVGLGPAANNYLLFVLGLAG